MSFTRYFDGLGSFGRFLGEAALAAEASEKAAVALSAAVVKKRVRGLYGDSTKLAALADATQADRVARGYSANDPLLRDGSLLRDSVESNVDGNYAEVGSDEMVALYHERGYFNVRAGKMTPARPVYRIALSESEKDLEAIAADAIAVTLGARSNLALPILDEGEA